MIPIRIAIGIHMLLLSLSGTAQVPSAASSAPEAVSSAPPTELSPIIFFVLGDGNAVPGAEVLIQAPPAADKILITKVDGTVTWTPPANSASARVRVIAKGWATYKSEIKVQWQSSHQINLKPLIE